MIQFKPHYQFLLINIPPSFVRMSLSALFNTPNDTLKGSKNSVFNNKVEERRHFSKVRSKLKHITHTIDWGMDKDT